MVSDSAAPKPGSPEDLAFRQVVDNVARQKLLEHNGLNYIPQANANKDRPPTPIDNTTDLSSTTQRTKADTDNINKIQSRTGTINNTYTMMPGYLSLELPPGTLPPQQKNPNVQDPNKPDPTNPKNPKNPTNPTGPTNPPGNQYPNYTPTYNPTVSPHSPTGSPKAVTPTAYTPTPNSPGGTDLSGINNPTTPSGTSFPTGDTSTNSPKYPTPGYPTPSTPDYPATGTPTPLPTTPTGTSKIPSSSTKLPGLNTGKVPGLGGGLPDSPSYSPSGGLAGGQNSGSTPSAGRVPTGSVNEAAAANASRGLQVEQAEAATAAAARGAGGYMPMMPMAGGMGAQSQQDRERSAWLTEDEDIWESDDDVAPPLIG
jgi:hypothetical protein